MTRFAKKVESKIEYRNLPISQRKECAGGGGSRQSFCQLAYLELTPACNSQCPGCLNESFISNFETRKLKEEFRHRPQTVAEWATVIDFLPPTTDMIILSGGEPTLHPEFLDIVRLLTERKLNFVIFTNGRWSNPTRILSFLKEMENFQGFLISLHGSSPKSHDAFVGVDGAFEETVQNIHLATQFSLPVSLSTVLTAENRDELIEIVQLGVNLEVEEISFNRYLLTPTRLHETRGRVNQLSQHQFLQVINQIEELRHTWADRISIDFGPCIPQCFAPSGSTGCSAGSASIVIDPWGNLKPCLHTDLLVGNILHDEFESIWNGQLLEEWRQLYDSSCPSCASYNQCGGGCRAMTLAYGLGRDPLMSKPIRAKSEENHLIHLDLIPVVV